MTVKDSYQPGTPCWIDIGSPDPDTTANFYSQLFGWQVDEPDPDPSYGGYRMARINGRSVAGIGPAQAEGTPWWTTYVSVDDADHTAKLVREAGGQVVAEPFDVGPFGRMAVFADPGGAPISVWQPREHIGAETVGEHGTLSWNELHTRDVQRAKDFYRKVFGWHGADVDMGLGFVYTVLKQTEDAEDTGVAGIMPMGEDQGDRQHLESDLARIGGLLPEHWKVYFSVDDCDATAAKATELGTTVIMPPSTMEGVGRMAALAGPHGEEIMIIASAPQAQGEG
ncbi:MAG TPA: VOC family protein [Pseudonocardiaceae bacterium]|nr:VOC family protein [Pseudonocardiaceae bacterium]